MIKIIKKEDGSLEEVGYELDKELNVVEEYRRSEEEMLELFWDGNDEVFDYSEEELDEIWENEKKRLVEEYG